MLILAIGETQIEGVDASPPPSSQPPKPGMLFDIIELGSLFSCLNSSMLCPVLLIVIILLVFSTRYTIIFTDMFMLILQLCGNWPGWRSSGSIALWSMLPTARMRNGMA